MFISELPFVNKVKFGNFWHAGSDVTLVCSKSVRRLVTKAIGDDRYWGMCGSVSLVSREGKQFGVFTRHQIGNAKIEELPEYFSENYLVPSLQPTFKNLSVTSLIFPTVDYDEEFYDVIAFTFNSLDEDVVREKPYFSTALLGQEVKNGHWFYIGYPNNSDSLIYDDEFTKVIDFKQTVCVNDCFPEHNYKGPKYLKKFKHSIKNYSVDGLSGGAIYCLTQTSKGFEISLDCVIVRGNNSYLYGINSHYLDHLLK